MIGVRASALAPFAFPVGVFVATVPTMQTFAAGEKLTAAKLNTNVRDAISFLLNPPRAGMGRNSTVFSVPNNAATPVDFDTELYDTDAMVNLGSSTQAITIVTPGWYDIVGQVSFASNNTGVRLGRITVNGTAVAADYAPAAAANGIVVNLKAQNVQLVAGDLVRLAAYQNSGVALNTLITAGERCFLTARWVAA